MFKCSVGHPHPRTRTEALRLSPGSTSDPAFCQNRLWKAAHDALTSGGPATHVAVLEWFPNYWVSLPALGRATVSIWTEKQQMYNFFLPTPFKYTNISKGSKSLNETSQCLLTKDDIKSLKTLETPNFSPPSYDPNKNKKASTYLCIGQCRCIHPLSCVAEYSQKPWSR